MPVLAAEQETQPFIRELWDKHKMKCVGNTVSNITLFSLLPSCLAIRTKKVKPCKSPQSTSQCYLRITTYKVVKAELVGKLEANPEVQ